MLLSPTFFTVLKNVVAYLTPLVFLEGILLLLMKEEKYSKIEEHLGKEIGGIRRRVIPRLENNIFTFQKWLLKRKIILGIFCMVYSVLLFTVLWK